jgi:hypothetical protein
MILKHLSLSRIHEPSMPSPLLQGCLVSTHTINTSLSAFATFGLAGISQRAQLPDLELCQ